MTFSGQSLAQVVHGVDADPGFDARPPGRTPRTADRPGARPDQLGAGGRIYGTGLLLLLLLAQANAFTRVGTGAGDAPGLAYTPRWRGLAPHRWSIGLPVQACWSLVRRRSRPPGRPRPRPRMQRQGLVVVLGSERSPWSRLSVVRGPGSKRSFEATKGHSASTPSTG